jgi:hypothetical protein
MAQEILIAECGGLSMVGSWHHELLLTLCADGTCSLRLRFQGDTNSYRPKGVRGIRTGQQFKAAIKELSDLSPVIDSIDFAHVSELLVEHRPGLAKDLDYLSSHDDLLEDLPSDIEEKISEILNSNKIYPRGCRSLIDRRLMWEEVRQSLISYFLKNQKLPESTIVVRDHIIQMEPV